MIAEQIVNPAVSDFVYWIHADPVTGSAQKVNKDGQGFDHLRTEYEPLGQEVEPLEPPSEDLPINMSSESSRSASEPEWLCSYASDDYWEMPTSCQQAALDRFGLDFLTKRREGNAQSVPSTPHGTGSGPGGTNTMPVNLTTTTKVLSASGGASFMSVSNIPSDNGEIIAVVQSESWKSDFDLDSNSAENGGLDTKWVPIPGNFKEQIQERLNTGDCNAWIAKLIAKAYEIGNRKRRLQYKDSVPEDLKPFAKDGLEALKKVTEQNGFVLVPYLKVGGLSAGGTVAGSMGEGTSQVKIRAFPLLTIWGKKDTTDMATQIYISSAIHELIHAAGIEWNGDSGLADALVELGELKVKRERKSFKTDADYEFARSGDWSAVLQLHCGIESKREKSK